MFSFDYRNLLINSNYINSMTGFFTPIRSWYFPSIFNNFNYFFPNIYSYQYNYPDFGMSFSQNTTFQDIFRNQYFLPNYNIQPNNIFNYQFPTFNTTYTPTYKNIFSNSTVNNSNISKIQPNNNDEKINIKRKSSTYNKRYTNFKLDRNFINRVKEISNKLNCDYKDLLAVMNSESGINPQAWNGTGAVGLIQFTNIALKDINQNYGTSYTKQEVGRMSGMEQLDLVEKFLLMVKKRNFPDNKRLSAGDLYALVFAPSIANQEVFYRRGTKAYAQNPLDLDNDGAITKTDLERHLAKKQVNLVA